MGDEAQRAAAVVGEREHDAPAKAVVGPPALARHDQAGVEKVLVAELLGARRLAQLVPCLLYTSDAADE